MLCRKPLISSFSTEAVVSETFYFVASDQTLLRRFQGGIEGFLQSLPTPFLVLPVPVLFRYFFRLSSWKASVVLPRLLPLRARAPTQPLQTGHRFGGVDFQTIEPSCDRDLAACELCLHDATKID